jgi:hypothetical protein
VRGMNFRADAREFEPRRHEEGRMKIEVGPWSPWSLAIFSGSVQAGWHGVKGEAECWA